MLVLSVFPGIDLLGKGFELEGFCVLRGPDILWGGDIKKFVPPKGIFGGVIGGPPCQPFSSATRMTGTKIPNLLPEFERVVAQAEPFFFLMENVPYVPDVSVNGYVVQRFLLNLRWLGEVQNRLRCFQFGTKEGLKIYPETKALASIDKEHCVVASEWKGAYRDGKARQGAPYKPPRSLEKICELQGLPKDFNIPPFRKSAMYDEAIGNGVPIAMGRAVAKAIKEVLPNVKD